MNLPKVVADLVKAQDKFDSAAYANCFSETAVVFDEGNTQKGRTQIQQWTEQTNGQYKTVVRPLTYEGTETEGVMSANISGTFEGSPIILKYHFVIVNGLIESMKITG